MCISLFKDKDQRLSRGGPKTAGLSLRLIGLWDDHDDLLKSSRFPASSNSFQIANHSCQLHHPSKVPSAIEAGLGSHRAQGDGFLSELGECVRITEDPKRTIYILYMYLQLFWQTTTKVPFSPQRSGLCVKPYVKYHGEPPRRGLGVFSLGNDDSLQAEWCLKGPCFDWKRPVA